MVIVGSGNPLRPSLIANNNLHPEKDISAGYQKNELCQRILLLHQSVPKYIVPFSRYMFREIR
jgi:hypothetical protein